MTQHSRTLLIAFQTRQNGTLARLLLERSIGSGLLFCCLLLGLLLHPATVAAQSFTFTGSMTAPRQSHTAALLGNGEVLIAGGDGTSGPLATAELYNPATGSFTATGPMGTVRAGHTATLLPNGQVLVAGGATAQGIQLPTAAAELYDPKEGKFIPTGSMNIHRVNHTATLLPNGQVLIAGGFGASCCNPLGSAELYNPATGAFTAIPAVMTTARAEHTATLLASGLVLITGGGDPFGRAPIASAELYNPATGAFTATGSMVTARAIHTATLLPRGQVLIAGGSGPLGPLSSTELYDPKAGTFTASGAMTTSRQGHTATLLPHGQVLIAGGFGDDRLGLLGFLGTAELYDPKTGTSSATAGTMTSAREFHSATLLGNGEVLIAGFSFNSAELFNSTGGVCTPGTAGCGWRYGDMFAFFQNSFQFGYGGALLTNDFNFVYGSQFGVLRVGITSGSGFSMAFDSGFNISAYLPAIGPPGPLTGNSLDPTGTSSGQFGGDVLALKLNVDFSDAGDTLMGSANLLFGNLSVCHFDTLPELNGLTVRQFLGNVNTLLGGGSLSSGYSIALLDPVTQNINSAFGFGSSGSGSPSTFAQQHLVNGACH